MQEHTSNQASFAIDCSLCFNSWKNDSIQVSSESITEREVTRKEFTNMRAIELLEKRQKITLVSEAITFTISSLIRCFILERITEELKLA